MLIKTENDYVCKGKIYNKAVGLYWITLDCTAVPNEVVSECIVHLAWEHLGIPQEELENKQTSYFAVADKHQELDE